jgi:hypothetical protein
MLICPLFVLAWRFESTIVVVLFGVLRSVLAVVGVVTRIVIKATPTTANTDLNTPNKTTTIVDSNLQANTNNGQININSQNLNILSSQDTNNTKSNTKLCLFCTLDTSRFLVLRLSWLVACRMAPLILVFWVVLRLMLVAVNINTQAHTQLTGSLIAATDTGDKDGNDNGQLSLTTNSLSASSLNTTTNNKSNSPL